MGKTRQTSTIIVRKIHKKLPLEISLDLDLESIDQTTSLLRPGLRRQSLRQGRANATLWKVQAGQTAPGSSTCRAFVSPLPPYARYQRIHIRILKLDTKPAVGSVSAMHGTIAGDAQVTAGDMNNDRHNKHS